MLFDVHRVLAAFAAGAPVLAATIIISVGPTLTFSPSTATPAVGDTLLFKFASAHSVSQSSFDAPCSPSSEGGFDSGVQASGATFSVTVNDTNPIWVYCSVPGHCQHGMVFAANAPANGTNTFHNFKTLATEGTIGAYSGFGSSSSSSSASVASTTSASSSSGSGAQYSKTWGVVAFGALCAGALVLGLLCMPGNR